MNEKQLDKWFADSCEIGEIDDFLRQRPDFNWSKLKLKDKISIYESFCGKIEQPKTQITTQFPNITRKVITTTIETLEGSPIKVNYIYSVEGSGSNEILAAYIKYGMLAPLPHTLYLKHDNDSVESLVEQLEDYFSRAKLSGKDKEKERFELWEEIKEKSADEIDKIIYERLVILYKDRPLALEFIPARYLKSKE